MTQYPKKPNQPAQSSPQPATRRVSPRRQREQARQRMVVIGSSVAVGLALLALLIGVLYDQVWVPSRPVAQVGSNTLSRGGYNQERREAIAREISQNLQLVRLFGGQLSGQFAGRTPALNTQVRSISVDAPDQATIEQWIDRQVVEQGAAKLNVQASDAEVAQAMFAGLRDAFPPPAQATSGTVGITPTAVLTPTTAPTSAATSAPTSAATPTLEPTPTTEPTLGPTESQAAEAPLVDRIFSAYDLDLRQTDRELRPNLTTADFLNGLRSQFRQQVLTAKVQEQLVPEAGFTPSQDLTAIETRQILISVTLPLSPTEQQREAAYAARKADIDAVYNQVRSGAQFSTVAEQRSEDATSRVQGGTVPSFDKDGKTADGNQIDLEYVKAALALNEGEISQPFRTPFGWHVIQLVKKSPTPTDEQLRTKRTEAFDAWKAQQRTELTVRFFPDQTATPTTLPTGTAAPLPTYVLGATPAPTAVPTIVATPTAAGTAGPTTTGTAAATAAATSAAGTAAPTTAATAAATSTAGTAAPTTAATAAATSAAATAAPTAAATSAAATAAPTP
ncbi:MAG TPA: peptidylprolyl isomerase [Roseiflexaceae bacterium]|nr:peptidylprolyl isomerase [Roseiflexaceae bacterium]